MNWWKNWWKACACIALSLASSALLLNATRSHEPSRSMRFVSPNRHTVELSTDSDTTYLAWQMELIPNGPYHDSGNFTLPVRDKQVVIEPQRLMINGQPAAVIPPGAKVIKLAERNRTVYVLADGKPLHRFTR